MRRLPYRPTDPTDYVQETFRSSREMPVHPTFFDEDGDVEEPRTGGASRLEDPLVQIQWAARCDRTPSIRAANHDGAECAAKIRDKRGYSRNIRESGAQFAMGVGRRQHTPRVRLGAHDPSVAKFERDGGEWRQRDAEARADLAAVLRAWHANTQSRKRGDSSRSNPGATRTAGSSPAVATLRRCAKSSRMKSRNPCGS